jgi:O-antigen/teichoic acid export membrane protein
MLLPVLLAFGVIGWEQLLHTTPGASRLPLYQIYQVFHLLSDGLLALPLAVAAEWLGQKLAARQHLGWRSPSHLVGRAALICLVYAVLLVPGAAIHEGIDTLTHAHEAIAVHSHVLTQAPDPFSLAGIVLFAAHALSDGLVGQVVGLPLTLLALVFVTRWRPARRPASI